MRVLNYINYHKGGITRYTAEVLKVMPAQVEMHVICPPGTSFDANDPSIHPCLIETSDIGFFSYRLRLLWSQYKNPSQMLRLIKTIRPDIIHFGNVNHLTYLYWGRFLKSFSIPFFVTVHDVRRDKCLVNRRWENRQLISIYQDAAGLFVHSVAQQIDLAEYTGIPLSKITIIPHGPYKYPLNDSPLDIRNKLGIPNNVQVGLFFGGVRDDKGLGELISAVASLPHDHLIVAGRCTGKHHKTISHFRKLARKLEAHKRIHFVESFIPEDRVVDYFRAADWCGLVYRSSFTSQSGVLCSAVHFKTPLLVASSPSLVETVQQYQIGVVATDSSIEALTFAMHQLRTATKKAQQFGFDKFDKESTWQRNANITCLTYLNAIKDK